MKYCRSWKALYIFHGNIFICIILWPAHRIYYVNKNCLCSTLRNHIEVVLHTISYNRSTKNATTTSMQQRYTVHKRDHIPFHLKTHRGKCKLIRLRIDSVFLCQLMLRGRLNKGNLYISALTSRHNRNHKQCIIFSVHYAYTRHKACVHSSSFSIDKNRKNFTFYVNSLFCILFSW